MEGANWIEKKFIQNTIVTSENIPEELNANQDDQVQMNLHNTQSISPLVTICRSSEEVRALIEKSNVLFALTPVNQVKTYTERFTLNKRNTKKSHIENINKSVMELINWHRVSPTENPFGHLWLAKCALFSTVVAFLLLKG